MCMVLVLSISDCTPCSRFASNSVCLMCGFFAAQITMLDGVVGYHSPLFWQHSADIVVGSIHVQGML
jgi:hypothetical protein